MMGRPLRTLKIKGVSNNGIEENFSNRVRGVKNLVCSRWTMTRFENPLCLMHRRCVPCLDRQRMRIKIVFLTTLALVSCGDLVRFEEPQPAGQSNEKGIPERLVGQYLSLDDSARLVIASGLIIKYSVSVFSDMIDSVDRKDIKGDTTYSGTEDKLKFDIVVKGDSAFQRWSYYDTLLT
jgi:hypothetical protein